MIHPFGACNELVVTLTTAHTNLAGRLKPSDAHWYAVVMDVLLNALEVIVACLVGERSGLLGKVHR